MNSDTREAIGTAIAAFVIIASGISIGSFVIYGIVKFIDYLLS